MEKMIVKKDRLELEIEGCPESFTLIAMTGEETASMYEDLKTLAGFNPLSKYLEKDVKKNTEAMERLMSMILRKPITMEFINKYLPGDATSQIFNAQMKLNGFELPATMKDAKKKVKSKK